MITETVSIQNIIKDSLKKSMSYNEYRVLVEQLVANNSTTGNDKSEAMVNYTMLNDRRMKRWDKTVKVSEEDKATIEAYNKKATWLLISESWCGDAAHIVPAINKVAELNGSIDLRIVLRDDNPELMDEFLTNGGKAIPKLIIIENEDVVNTFGPRPSEATQLVVAYKAKHGKITAEFKEDLQRWYNKNKGQNVIKDLVKLLSA